jgi:hypothetical protein
MSLSKRDILKYMMVNFNASLTIPTNSNNSNNMSDLNELLFYLHNVLAIDNIGKTITISCDNENNINYTPIVNGFILSNTTLPTSNNSITVNVYIDISNIISTIYNIYNIIQKNYPPVLGLETISGYFVSIPFNRELIVDAILISNSENYTIFLQGIMSESLSYPITNIGLYDYITSLINSYNNNNNTNNNIILSIGQLFILNDTLNNNSPNFQNILLSVNDIL